MSKEIKFSIQILVGQAVVEILIQTFFFDWFETFSKTKILLKFQCRFWVPWTIQFHMHMIFFKKVLTILRFTRFFEILFEVESAVPLNCTHSMWRVMTATYPCLSWVLSIQSFHSHRACILCILTKFTSKVIWGVTFDSTNRLHIIDQKVIGCLHSSSKCSGCNPPVMWFCSHNKKTPT